MNPTTKRALDAIAQALATDPKDFARACFADGPEADMYKQAMNTAKRIASVAGEVEGLMEAAVRAKGVAERLAAEGNAAVADMFSRFGDALIRRAKNRSDVARVREGGGT